jgi:adenosylcobinamide kinase/adenosylcobinamide-phosphate guanylyltransferase
VRSGKLLLVSGGARSGKSTFAENHAKISGREVVYVATSQVLDEEMRARVKAHRRFRPSSWPTVEEPYALEKVLWHHGRRRERLLLIDCLTLWLSNIMLEKLGFDGEQLTGREPDPVIVTDIIARAKNTAALAAKVPAEVVVVTNEVGWGLVPENPLARLYRDLAGKVNQAFATAADEVYMLVAGLPLRLK